MKILSISSNFPKSSNPMSGIFIYREFLRLSSLADISVIVPHKYGDPRTYLCKRSKSVLDLEFPYKVYSCQYLFFPKIEKIKVSIMQKSIYKTIIQDKLNFDIIHGAFGYPDGLISTRLAKKFNVPSTIALKGSDIFLYPEKPAVKKLLLEGLNNANHIIAVCKKAKETAISYGINPDKISVIHGSYEPEIFNTKNKQISSKKQIIFVGSLIKLKGCSDLLKAFSKLDDKNIILKICGDGPLLNDLKNESQSLGVSERFEFTGLLSQNQIAKILNRSSLLCLPSYSEGLSNVLLEALGSGVPVVTTNVGGIPEVIDKTCGYLFTPGNIDELVNVLQKSLSREWDTNKLVEKVQDMTYDRYAQKMYNIFERVLKEQV